MKSEIISIIFCEKKQKREKKRPSTAFYFWTSVMEEMSCIALGAHAFTRQFREVRG